MRCKKIKNWEMQLEYTSKLEVESNNQIFSVPTFSLLSIKKRVEERALIVNGPIAVARKKGTI